MHLGRSGAICSYWIDGAEPALVDPGPTPSLEGLEAGLAVHGLGMGDVRHLLLTHVHLDHAGGTGHLVERYPDLTVHVHVDGAEHLADPERLVASTRRTFEDRHDRLWGEVLPVPTERIRAWEPSTRLPVPGVRAFPTPGHIGHHVAYLAEADGILLTGDTMGVILTPDAPTHPSGPPPSVNVPAWLDTLETIESIGPDLFGPTHFGLHGDVAGRTAQLRERMLALRDRVQRALASGDDGDRAAFESEVRDELSQFRPREEIDDYFDAFNATMDWDGMEHYLKKAAPGS
jgi:glyoxylase-like metal-dependent hydrolase (beta-lactamase superfamily II)